MEVEEKEHAEGEDGKPLISLFASFQDYLSNDQEIREVRVARFPAACTSVDVFPKSASKKHF